MIVPSVSFGRLFSIMLVLTVKAVAQTIPNPSFEANSFNVAPGYVSGNTAITGWTASNTGRAGLNPAGGTPFADNGAVPNGSNVAFIQSTGIGSITLSTTITGLTAGRTYRLQFRANCRGAYTPPIATYAIANGVPVPFTASPSVGGATAYYFVVGNFTATAASATLQIRNETITAGSDSALLVDDFSIAQVDPFTLASWSDDASSGIAANSTWAYHFGSTTGTLVNGRVVPGIGTAAPTVVGQFAVTGVTQVFPNDTNTLTALTGTGSAVMARDFIWGGNPATVTLQGLTPGSTYVVSFLSVGWDATGARPVTFTSGSDTKSINQDALGDNAGIRVDYSFQATGSSRTITIAQQVPGYSWHLYGLALRQTSAIADTAQYRFDSLNKRITDGDGVPVSFVEGVVLNQVVEKSDAVEFSFGNSLNFDAADLVTFMGPKPVRILVNGDVNIPTGATFNANPSLSGGVAGGGNGAPTTPGGSGGTPMTVHYHYFNNTLSVPHPLSRWEILIQQNGHAFVLPRPGTGGAGGLQNGTAGVKGQPGIGSGTVGASQGAVGPDQDERLWSDPIHLVYGYGGAVPTLQSNLPGFIKANGAAGSVGWNNPAPAPGGGMTGVFETVCVPSLPPSCILYTTEWGAGGQPGGGGGLLSNGDPGADGAKGADANHNGTGNGAPGFRGGGGRYALNDPAAPVLRGGHGGGAGGAGSGGAAGAPGGAGGGGGGGGGSTIGIGGAGGAGGQGKFGGAGGAGGTGGAGGSGGGAFEISATGNIVVGGTLTARGGNGATGGDPQAGLASTVVMPGHPEYTVDPTGKAGTPGSNTSGIPTGSGGRGGNGGEGGRGGDGGDGAGGGGGAGGTIILRGSNVSFTGNTSASAHLDVSAGTPGGGGIVSTAQASQPGAYFVIPTPSIGLSQTFFSYTINRGQTVVLLW